MIGDRLPRVVGHGVNIAISLVIWRAIAVASVGILHWGALLGT
jgi:hypothetical protein